MNDEELLGIDDILRITGLKPTCLYKRLSVRKVKPVKKVNGLNMYAKSVLDIVTPKVNPSSLRGVTSVKPEQKQRLCRIGVRNNGERQYVIKHAGVTAGDAFSLVYKLKKTYDHVAMIW